MGYYSKRHYALVSPKPDTQEQIAERLRHRKACEQAGAETLARYPTLTAENIREAMDFQERRIKELMMETA